MSSQFVCQEDIDYVVTFLHGLFADKAVAVDEINGFIYWRETGRGIIKAALNTSNQQDIVNPGESKCIYYLQ